MNFLSQTLSILLGTFCRKLFRRFRVDLQRFPRLTAYCSTKLRQNERVDLIVCYKNDNKVIIIIKLKPRAMQEKSREKE